MLILATVLWGYSFPAGKALMKAYAAELPGQSEWFFSALMISLRFLLAAALLVAVQPRALGQMRADEWRQGIGLGVFAGLGMLFQADGLHYTKASSVAFLTQFTAVLVPIYCAMRDRRSPGMKILACIVMVMAGVAILGDFNWQTMQLGRGEVETLIGAGFFTAQILWLDHPKFRGNSAGRVSIVMFAACGLVLAPVWIAHSKTIGDVAVVLMSAKSIAVFLSLTVLCSLLAFLLMNHWQPHVDATTAGIVYCAEPLFTTVMALLLPEVLGGWLGVTYPNEKFTQNLIIGGGLITVANVLIALQPSGELSEGVHPA